MTGIPSLPPELILHIAVYLRPVVHPIDSDEALMNKPRVLERWFKTPRIILDTEEERERLGGKRIYYQHIPMNRGQRKTSHLGTYSDLRAMRQVNRLFYEICTPFIYMELDIAPKEAEMNIASTALSSHADHIRHLHIVIPDTPPGNPLSEKYENLILQILRTCQRTSSLALYYKSNVCVSVPTTDSFMANLNSSVTLLATKGFLSSLGIYSFTVKDRAYTLLTEPPRGPPSLLRALIPHLPHTPSLKCLDIACETISPGNSPDIYDGIRRHATYLQSLSFLRCIRNVSSPLWNSHAKWAPNINLTRLRLVSCQNAHASHIPEIVRHFSSLKCLVVAACGDDSDEIPPPRTTGSSRSPDALWRRRPPLDVFHIEYMSEWEILAMGTIPAKTVIATSMPGGEPGISFSKDPELFPSLSLVRIEPNGYMTDTEAQEEASWRRMMTGTRGVTIKEDAEWLYSDEYTD